MHGELAMLVAATSGVVATAVAILVRRPGTVADRLASLARRFRE